MIEINVRRIDDYNKEVIINNFDETEKINLGILDAVDQIDLIETLSYAIEELLCGLRKCV